MGVRRTPRTTVIDLIDGRDTHESEKDRADRGWLFVITFVTAIPAALPYGPVLDRARYVAAGADGRIALGAFLEMLLIVANIGTAVAPFPILKRQNESLALVIGGAPRAGSPVAK
jgi:hypothetical protein